MGTRLMPWTGNERRESQDEWLKLANERSNGRAFFFLNVSRQQFVAREFTRLMPDVPKPGLQSQRCPAAHNGRLLPRGKNRRTKPSLHLRLRSVCRQTPATTTLTSFAPNA